MCGTTPGKERYGVKLKVEEQITSRTLLVAIPSLVPFVNAMSILFVFQSLPKVQSKQVRIGNRFSDPNEAAHVARLFKKLVSYNRQAG